tara:strand:+ start:279 stop:464 length:186 start_codon:yes stop_codon:yes gene_type:complete
MTDIEILAAKRAADRLNINNRPTRQERMRAIAEGREIGQIEEVKKVEEVKKPAMRRFAKKQ